MSYKTHLIGQRFRIKTDQFVLAWKVLLAKKYGVTQDYFGTHFPRTLVEVLDGVGLRAEVDDQGNIKSVEWNSDTNGYHIQEFIKAIAPYVNKGSYLKFHDEYGQITIYRFNGTGVDQETTGGEDDEEEDV